MAKNRAWQDIQNAIVTECPLEKPKGVKEVKKKWQSLTMDARKHITAFKKARQATGIYIGQYPW